jgi:hypothetical protein
VSESGNKKKSKFKRKSDWCELVVYIGGRSAGRRCNRRDEDVTDDDGPKSQQPQLLQFYSSCPSLLPGSVDWWW